MDAREIDCDVVSWTELAWNMYWQWCMLKLAIGHFLNSIVSIGCSENPLNYRANTRAVWKFRGLNLLLRLCFREVGGELPREVLGKRDRHRPSMKFRFGIIRWFHELFKRTSFSAILNRFSFKKTVTLMMVRGMKITPLLRYPTTTTWRNNHRLSLRNSGVLPPVHEPSKRPSYV
jgi:hypothetical protein